MRYVDFVINLGSKSISIVTVASLSLFLPLKNNRWWHRERQMHLQICVALIIIKHHYHHHHHHPRQACITNLITIQNRCNCHAIHATRSRIIDNVEIVIIFFFFVVRDHWAYIIGSASTCFHVTIDMYMLMMRANEIETKIFEHREHVSKKTCSSSYNDDNEPSTLLVVTSEATF